MAQYVFTMNRVGKVVPPKRVILKDISLSFFPGAKIGVLGLNGSGKSSLLRIMAGEDKDHEGDAVPMPNMNIGFLPQEPALDPKQTVRQAVEGAHRNGRHVGICGQAPADDPEMAAYVVELGIDSISVTPDTLLKVTRAVLAVEQRLGRSPRGKLAMQEAA